MDPLTAVPRQDDHDVNFNHPFTPYDVQLEFMRTVYDVLQRGNGQVGILESPTGTGKSLSLICASLTWLRNFKRGRFETSMDGDAEKFKDEPSWVIEQMLQRKRDELTRRWEEREQRLAHIRQKEKLEEQRAAKRRHVDVASLRGRAGGTGDDGDDDDEEFLLDWDGGDDSDSASGRGLGRERDSALLFSKETRELMEKFGLSGVKKPGQEEEEEGGVEEEVKIFYTSRTHSQLTQFISELRRPSFPPSFPGAGKKASGPEKDVDGRRKHEQRRGKEQVECVKHVPLSSRQKLCINPAVSRLGSLGAINDRCAELQKPKSTGKCPFDLNQDNLSETHQFRDTALATVPDIEDVHRLGKSMQVCPYYASRTAVPGAEIVTLPYPLLLQKTARDALGIKLAGSVVIIDEAHNIMDAIASVHAAVVRLSELKRAKEMLAVYAKRFGKKLKGENRVMVGQLARVIQGLSEWLDRTLQVATINQGIVDPNSLLSSKGIDQINMFSLIRYIQESKLAYKIESYAAHVDEQGANAGGQKTASSSPVLHTLSGFLLALTNLSTEGRIFYEKLPLSTTQHQTADIKLSYLLLSPTHAFSSIVSSARAVILAGGTMSPFQDYKTHLFPTLAAESITTLSCGHVIPPSSLCVWTLASSQPTNSNSNNIHPGQFEFSFQRRRDATMIGQLGTALLNMCSVVPDGVVVFFPSYGYLDEVVAAWQKKSLGSDLGAAGAPGRPSIWDRLQGKKAVFRESKGGSSDEILQEYSKAILGDLSGGSRSAAKTMAGVPRGGALLLSVVGGKMSEGINFSDRLGRCVVIVGLPYPNVASAEWKARMEYIEASTVAGLTGSPSVMNREQAVAAGKHASRDFYENACMRAVNQSIGRAIRHQSDYAAIVLLDRRFGTDRIRAKLPVWVRGGMVPGSEEKGLPGLMGALNGFFRGKRTAGGG